MQDRNTHRNDFLGRASFDNNCYLLLLLHIDRVVIIEAALTVLSDEKIIFWPQKKVQIW